MKTLWDLTRRIASIVNTLLGRVGTLEDRSHSQEQRLDALENSRETEPHSLQSAHEQRMQNEEKRQDTLTEDELRKDLATQYGKSNWANKLIEFIVLKRIRRGK